MLNDEAEAVRAAAAVSLLKLGEHEMESWIHDKLKNPPDQLRGAILEQLLRLKPSERARRTGSGASSNARSRT